MTLELRLKSCALLLFVAASSATIVLCGQDMLIRNTVLLLNGIPTP